VIRRLVRFLDQRAGAAPLLRKQLRYLFPDHWSFLLGEVALYCFIVLVATGTYLALFYEDSTHQVVYRGHYAPLQGQHMSEAYRSVLDLSTTVKAGLLIRQTHHWAANVFIAAIGNAVLLSLPLIGANLALLLWDGPFPGGPDFFPRMYIAHVFLIPALIAVLLSAHLFLVASRHHTQFAREPRQTERKLVGVPTFPGQTPRSIGLLLAVAGTLFLLGGLVQINPIWLWGPYHVSLSTNGAQPDWYLGWLIGALRLMPGFDVTIGDYTLVPNPFWGGILLPLLVFGFLFVWPVVERKLMRDDAYHNLLDRPRDAPLRTALGTMVFVAASVTFLAGSADRVTVLLGLSYTKQVWFYRILFLAGPPLAGLIAHRVCVELRRGERVEEDIARARAEAEASSAD
jgi:ubiquinol-cytochrome c reductase cytochrome b subunit